MKSGKDLTNVSREFARVGDAHFCQKSLNEIDGFKCAMLEGAFYAFVDVRGMLSERFATSADIACC